METPLSPRVPSITNHDRTTYSPIVAKENFSLIGGPGTGNGFLVNQGKENECTGSVDEDFEEHEQQVRSRKAQTINNVHGKRTGNNSNKKKSLRKRRVTANLSATKYDIGEGTRHFAVEKQTRFYHELNAWAPDCCDYQGDMITKITVHLQRVTKVYV